MRGQLLEHSCSSNNLPLGLHLELSLRIMPNDPQLQRLKALFLISSGLAVAAISGWGGFAYMTSSANSLSSQVATLVENRNAMRIQRAAALQKLEQLQQPPRDLAQIDARLIAVGTEYNRLWELAKAKRLHASRDVDSAPTGSVQKTEPKQAR
jgi:outer membrane murein-binding lipoprotein Lpp